MHRHGYQGRKFGRQRDQRRALLRGLMLSLVRHQAVETTLPKAKELRPRFEKVISRACRGDLSSRRRVIALLGNIELAHLLVDVIAPQLKRSSGYLRIVKLDRRRVGDNAPLARIEFVDEIVITSESAPVIASEAKQSTEPKAPDAALAASPSQPAVDNTDPVTASDTPPVIARSNATKQSSNGKKETK